MFKDRTKNTDKFSEIAKKFGESDLRFGQAISNYMKVIEQEGKDIFFLENDEFEQGLIDELKKLGRYSDI